MDSEITIKLDDVQKQSYSMRWVPARFGENPTDEERS